MSGPSRGASDRLAAAKLWLISETTADLGYLARAIYALVPVPSTEVERLAADEYWRLYLNEGWLLDADVPEVGRELAHLTWHLLMSHADRARSLFVDRRTAADWALATDLTVAHTLGPERCIPASVESAVREPRPAALTHRLGEHRSSEEYYAALSGLPTPPRGGAEDDPLAGELPSCGSVCDGIPRAHDQPPTGGSGAVDQIEGDTIRRAVAIDYEQHVTSRGDRPGDALRWARSLTDPQIPWEPILNRAVRRAVGWTSGRTEYTWSRPSRRQSALPRVRLPGTRRPVPRVSVIVDTSGSMDDHLLGTAVSEVTGALASLGIAGAAVTVYSCDAAVGAVSVARGIEDIVLTGGGGTDLTVAFDRIALDRPRPDVIVALTDGFTPWPDVAPIGAACVIGVLGRRGDVFPPTPDWAVRVECWRD